MEEPRAKLRPSYGKGAIMGGFVTVFSMVPVLSCCCCLWWPIGGAVSAWVASRPVYPFGPAEGFRGGILAGVIGAIVGSVVLVSSGYLDPQQQNDLWGPMIEDLQTSSPELYEQNREFWDTMPERMKEMLERPATVPGILGVSAVLIIAAASVGGLLAGLWIRNRDERERAMNPRFGEDDEPREPPVQ